MRTWRAHGNPAAVLINDAQKPLTLRDWRIDASPGATFGVHVRGATDVLIENVVVVGSAYHGIVLETCSNVTIRSVTVTDCGTAANPTSSGIFLSGCSNVEIDDCDFHNNYSHGVYALGGTESVLAITNSRARGNGGSGFAIKTDSSTVTDCEAWNNNVGFSTSNSLQGDDPQESNDIEFVRCYAHDNAVAEFSIGNCATGTLTDCTAESSTALVGLRTWKGGIIVATGFTASGGVGWVMATKHAETTSLTVNGEPIT